jgi:serine phosphatase RsbU (regulator of sigma subunit)
VALQALGYDRCGVFLVEPQVGALVGHWSSHQGEEVSIGPTVDLTSEAVAPPLWRIKGKARGPIPPPVAPPLEARVPMRVADALVGILAVSNAESRRPVAPADLMALQCFADQVALALLRARGSELGALAPVLGASTPSQMDSIPGFELSAFYQPARTDSEPCGDFHDLFALSEHAYGIVIADISGKGARAATHADMLRTMLRSFAHLDPSPQRVLERLNTVMLGEAQSDQFVTLFYARVDTEQGTLTYASAGHEPMLAVTRAGRLELLESTGTVLGAALDVPYFEDTRDLADLEALVLYTDGVTDAHPPCSPERFGLERLMQEVGLHGKGTALELLKGVLRDVFAFSQGTCVDDLSMLVMRRCDPAA